MTPPAAKANPILTPSSLGSFARFAFLEKRYHVRFIAEHPQENSIPDIAGTAAIPAPEKNPKNIANKIVLVLSCTAFIQKMIMPVPKIMNVPRFMTPIYGARGPGAHRPKKLAALRIEV